MTQEHTLYAGIITTLGAFLLMGLLIDGIARRTVLPRVTLLMLSGVLVGQSGFDIIPDALVRHFELVADIALLVIGFLLGGQLKLSHLKDTHEGVIRISLLETIATFVLVSGGLFLMSVPPGVSLVLGGIAAASAPAAIVDLVMERKLKTPFTATLLAVVAIDDVWALLLFSAVLSGLNYVNGSGAASTLFDALTHMGGAMVIGVAIGLPAAYLTGRIKPGQPTLLEAMGLVLLCGGIAMWAGVSHLIAVITMGAVIVNLASHHDKPFHAVEHIEWPCMLIFFILAGATLDIAALLPIGVLGVAYIALRCSGKYLGCWLGGKVTQASPAVTQYLGLALFPQAGVAIGLGLIAANALPAYQQTILPLIMGTTVVFELFGPPVAAMALRFVQNSRKPSDM